MRVPIQDAAREAAEIVEFGFLVSDRDLYMTMTREYPRLRGHWEEFIAELEAIGRRRRTFAHAGSSWCLHRYAPEQHARTQRRWWQRGRGMRATPAAQRTLHVAGGAVSEPSAPSPAAPTDYEVRQAMPRRGAQTLSVAEARHEGHDHVDGRCCG